MTTPFRNSYAFGVRSSVPGRRKTVGHGGGIEGFNTTLAYYPDSKVTIAVLGKSERSGVRAGIAGKP